MNPLPSGKLAPDALERSVLSFGGALRPELLVGPAVGEDAAVIRWPEGKYLIFTSDPIVGAGAGAGRLLVQVNANDVASKGGDPAFLAVTLILPPALGEAGACALMSEIHRACEELGVAVAGGHTEFNDRYDHPVLMGAMIGTADRVLSARDVRPGDRLVVTKHLAIEGMSILAQDRPDLLGAALDPEELREVASWSGATSVLPEARELRDLARFLHDPTEGGFRGGVSEAERLAGWTFRTEADRVPLHPLTRRAAQALGFDPLCLIASGSLLAVLPPEALGEAGRRLDARGIPWAEVGEVTEEPFGGEVSTREELWGLLRRPREGRS